MRVFLPLMSWLYSYSSQSFILPLFFIIFLSVITSLTSRTSDSSGKTLNTPNHWQKLVHTYFPLWTLPWQSLCLRLHDVPIFYMASCSHISWITTSCIFMLQHVAHVILIGMSINLSLMMLQCVSFWLSLTFSPSYLHILKEAQDKADEPDSLLLDTLTDFLSSISFFGC